ncbi:MAG: ImmA/IrrE family metallo-endopeptidase [bacterium]
MKKILEDFKKRGVRVIFWPLKTCSGALYLYRDHWFCFVNSLEPITRQRFTLAHELYHFDFHRELSDLFTDFGGKDYFEREANKGAAEYLMPASLIFAAYEALHNSGFYSVEVMSAYFGVSKQAMSIRLKELGLERR